MPNTNAKRVPVRTVLAVGGILILILCAVFLLWTANANSNQAISAVAAKVYFVGEYRIGDGPWQTIEKGQHIPSSRGDVTLRGNFHMTSPGGEYIGVYKGTTPIAFYTDHISVTFFEDGKEPYTIDHENPLFGESACGVDWTSHAFSGGDAPIEILIHNPHSYGNETAIDELLAGTAFWGYMDFEKDILDSGKYQRNTGLLFVIVSLVLLGTALFSTLIHIKNSNILWLFGMVILFAGAYFIFSAEGVSFWNDSIVTNTIVLGSSMIFYMLSLSLVITQFLRGTKKIAATSVILLGATACAWFILPAAGVMRFYDTWLWWVVFQLIVNVVLLGCLVREFAVCRDKKIRWVYIGNMLPLAAFGIDAVMTALGTWQGGVISKPVFIIMFIAALIVVLRIIPRSINTAAKAKELETERNALNAQLAQSRISTMMSQIRPHFIYNTLGSIEYLCEEDPQKARKLVHSFAKYLRGNFGELDNPRPIPMSQEMEHVRHYVSIENVRFPDMTFTFETESDNFMLPALTVQPIVENAIKHGLMPLDHGGSIRVCSWETPSHYRVSIEDDGVGFDTAILDTDRKHIGLRNIRGRLETMVDGTLHIESTPGKGTKVLISIPKESCKK
ncbi:MAG: histidine kinase [Clostridia bacterium]|nr:histidine kinase [Clostridia bacterium]